MSSRKFTEEQKAVIEASRTSKSLVVNALAGSGKTSTAIACIEANKKAKRMAYLCFNRSNRLEMEKKTSSSRVDVTTLHALAFRHVGKAMNRELGTLKAWQLENDCEFWHDGAHGGGKIVDKKLLTRARKLLLDNLSDWCHSRESRWEDFFDLEKPHEMAFQLERAGVDREKFDNETRKYWNLLIEDGGRPITHDIYLKLYQIGLSQKPEAAGYDLVIVDEAQDLFPVTEAMVDAMRKGGARVLFFGDRYQQIYNWNRSVNAMQFFERGSDVLALTQSFRCPENVVREAQKYLALLGFKQTMRPCPAPCELDFHAPLLLSRTNAGLFSTLFQVLSLAEMGEIHLMGGVESYNFSPIEDYLYFMAGKTDKIRNPVVQMMSGDDDYSEYAEMAGDREMLNARSLVRGFGPQKIIELVNMMKSGKLAPDRRSAKYVLSTGHKSKGSEFESVVIGPTYANLRQQCADHELGVEKRKGCGAEALERARARLDPEGKNPLFVPAEELRLNYVSLTRSTNGLAAGTLALSNEDIEYVNNFIRQGKLVFTDMDERGNLVAAN